MGGRFSYFMIDDGRLDNAHTQTVSAHAESGAATRGRNCWMMKKTDDQL